MEKTTFLLTMKDGTLKKVTVPSDWKVTFGPLCPGSKGETNGYGSTSLRFYTGKDKQKAVFTQVESFRDMDIEIEERVTTTRKETYIKQGDDQGEAVVVDHNVHEWINPDSPPKGYQAPQRPGGLLGNKVAEQFAEAEDVSHSHNAKRAR